MVSTRTAVCFVLASLFFGGTFVAAKAGLAYFPPLLFVAIRFDLAAVLMLVYVGLTTSRSELVPRTRGDLGGILATGVLAIGMTNALLFVGQQYVTSAVASIVYSLNPIMTPVFAAALLSDERLSRRGGVGMGLGLLGVGLVVSPDPANLLGGAVGKGILFVGAISAALGAVLIRRAESTISSSVRIAWGLPFAAALCHLLAWSSGESTAAITWTSEAVLALAYVSVFAGVLAYIAYFALLDDAGAIRANLIFYVVPVVSTLGGWALLGETIDAMAIAGFLTIFAGFAVLGSKSIDVRGLLPAVSTDAPLSDDDDAAAREEPRGYHSD
ncbi:DMT family transporter [Natrinema salifodinae]|uniref:Permease of the drug/metabolite transporter (DMT) superfamily n=1 Tax=Natrinema salifodinae TaxID=1202768 RepID=A0A1I0PCX5_9EURY|nr:DMT family transporter [Natrinema salifodinae]SEW11452.1 Permease of the drug/metabolite transporter (DMT) superfamily [Natrinema salifodinae]